MADEFKHLSLLEKENLIEQLQELVKGLQKGSLTLSKGKSSVTLKPEGLIEFSVKAKSKSGKRQLEVVLEWRDSSRKDRYHKRPLIIE